MKSDVSTHMGESRGARDQSVVVPLGHDRVPKIHRSYKYVPDLLLSIYFAARPVFSGRARKILVRRLGSIYSDGRDEDGHAHTHGRIKGQQGELKGGRDQRIVVALGRSA